MQQHELESFFTKLIGEKLEIIFNSNFSDAIMKLKLSSFVFSAGGHRSKVSDSMIQHKHISLHDELHNISFQFEYEDIEQVIQEKYELHLIYRDGTNIYKNKL